MIFKLWKEQDTSTHIDIINDALKQHGLHIELQDCDNRSITYSLINLKEVYSEYNHPSLTPEEIYQGQFKSAFDLIESFQMSRSELKGFKIIYAYYSYEDYSGNAFLLLEKNNELYEVNGSHCSCYGLEGQFEPEKTSLEYFQHIFEKGNVYDTLPLLKEFLS